MPRYERYRGESARAAQARIARNRAKDRTGGVGRGTRRNANHRNNRRPNQVVGQHNHEMGHVHEGGYHQHFVGGEVTSGPAGYPTTGTVVAASGSFQTNRSGIHQHNTGQIGGRQTRRNMGSRNPRRGRRR